MNTEFKAGDRVRLKWDISDFFYEFKKGHEFNVEDITCFNKVLALKDTKTGKRLECVYRSSNFELVEEKDMNNLKDMTIYVGGVSGLINMVRHRLLDHGYVNFNPAGVKANHKGCNYIATRNGSILFYDCFDNYDGAVLNVADFLNFSKEDCIEIDYSESELLLKDIMCTTMSTMAILERFCELDDFNVKYDSDGLSHGEGLWSVSFLYDDTNYGHESGYLLDACISALTAHIHFLDKK